MRKVVKRTNKKNKKLIWLVVLVLIVGIGFSALQKTLQINGNAIIDGNFSVGISDISKASSTGGAVELSRPTYTESTASFNVGLLVPGDSVTYNVTIQNGGNINAKLEQLALEQFGNSNIKYEVIGIEEGFILGAPDEKVFQVKVSYVESQEQNDNPYKEAKLTLTFVQTKESTSFQDEWISDFEERVPILSTHFTGYDSYVSASFGDFYTQDSEGAINVYDLASDKLLVLQSESRDDEALKMEYNKEYFLYGIVRDTVNGEAVYTQRSDVKNYMLRIDENGFVRNYGTYDNVTYEIVAYSKDKNVSVVTLPNDVYLTKVNGNIFSKNDIVNTVKIPRDFDLSKLEAYAFSNKIKKIVNLTGQSTNWGPIIGVKTNCEFETGTCGDVTITNVE